MKYLFLVVLFLSATVAAQVSTPPTGPMSFGSVPGQAAAPPDATFVTATDESSRLASSRRLAAGSGVSLTDAGAGSTLTVANTGETNQACELTGGANCQMTGQVRLQAGGTSPQLTWHGSDGSGTAANFGISKVGNTISLFANNTTTSVGAFGIDSFMARGNGGHYMIQCFDGAVYEYCQLFTSSSASAGAYLDVYGKVRVDDGTAAAPTFAWRNEPATGFYKPTNGSIGASISGTLAFNIGSGTSATIYNLQGMNDTTGSGGVARGVFQPPRSVGTTTVPPPACTSATEGSEFYISDRDDSKPPLKCWCVLGADNVTYAWVSMSLVSGGTMQSGCTP